MIPADELAALTIAIEYLRTETAQPAALSTRWKMAGRLPELDRDDLRAHY